MTPVTSAPWRILPEHPNLEQLKKQAKELHRDYLAGKTDAVLEVAKMEMAPRAHAFALADAQRVLARAYGYRSWNALKKSVYPPSVASLCEAAGSGNLPVLRRILRTAPELVNTDLAENDERRAIHIAVLSRQAEAVRILMHAGADAHKGVYPNRDATTASIFAADRGYTEIVAIIELAEQHRREAASCPNVLVSPLQEQINTAIRNGKNADAKNWLSADLTLVKACDRDGASPLHIAAGALNDEMAAWLLQHGASIVKLDAGGRTPMERAVFAVESQNKGSHERFKLVCDRLMSHGAPLSLAESIAVGQVEPVAEYFRNNPELFAPGAMQVNPLSLAVRHRQLEMLRLLLDLGLDPDERVRLGNLESEVYSAGQPLWYAVVDGDRAMAKLLLDRGADPNGAVYASGTPTSQAFGTRNVPLQELLIERGGKLTPEFVGLYRQTDRARRLLDGSELVEVDADSYSGPTLQEQLLWGASCGGDAEIVRLALQQIHWQPDDARWFNMAVQPLRIWNHGPGHWTGGYDRSTYLLCFRQIIERCDVNTLSRQGATLLHRAASDGTTWGREVMTSDERVGFAIALLNAGARFDARDTLLKSTPLAWAARWNRPELVELYLSRGASANETSAEPWALPLAWAVRYRRDDIADMLRSAGA